MIRHSLLLSVSRSNRSGAAAVFVRAVSRYSRRSEIGVAVAALASVHGIVGVNLSDAGMPHETLLNVTPNFLYEKLSKCIPAIMRFIRMRTPLSRAASSLRM